MNDPNEQNSDSRPGPFADANIERLLSESYRPEAIDPDFAARVTERVVVAAAKRRGAGRGNFRLYRVLTWSIAAAALVLLGMGISSLLRNARDKDGGTANPTDVAHQNPDAPVSVRKVQPATFSSDRAPAMLVADTYLVPRPRRQPPAVQPAAAGETIHTGPREHRRVGLGGGSVAYLNETSVLRVDGARRVTLLSGEAFVDIAGDGAAAGPEQQGDAAKSDDIFVITTPGREIRTPGGKFLAKVGPSGTGVLVTQGKVRVSGIDAPLGAGERLDAEHAPTAGHEPTISSAPRASAALAWARDLVAESDTPLVPDNHYSGGALVARDPSGQETTLSLRSYHIDVHMEDGFARTTIDQTYFNDDVHRAEGTFYFPLPPDASLSRLAMYVDGNLMEGGMTERDYARKVYDSIVTTMRDPALLEWVDGTTFKMRVFPLEPRQEKRIILSYTQRLPSLYGRGEYRFPAGHSLGFVNDWSFHLRAKGSAARAWDSPSHTLAATVEGGDLLLDAKARHAALDRDVVLHLADGTSSDHARFSSFEQDGQRYLMLRYRPELAAGKARQRRDWVFLFEASANRNPLLARAQVEVIRNVLANAEHDDTFAILTANTQAHALFEGRRPATAENVAAAIAELEKTHLIGALDLGAAFDAAGPLVQGSANPWLVHVGAGLVSMGERREDVLAKRVPAGAHYVGVAIGKHWSHGLMKSAAGRTGGYFTQINPDEPLAWRAFDLVSALNSPRLMGLKVTDEAGHAAFLCCDDAAAAGDEICAAARLSAAEPTPTMLAVSGTLDGQPWKQFVAVDSVAPGAAYLPRTWARLQIDALLADDAQAHRAEIVELSKAMYVMSPFTSLLVLENEQAYAKYNVDRGRKDHWAMYPCPQRIEVVKEPAPAVAAVPATQPIAPPSADDCLRTILVRPRVTPVRWPNARRGSEGQFVTVYPFQTNSGIGYAPYTRVYDVRDLLIDVPDFTDDPDYLLNSAGNNLFGNTRAWFGWPEFDDNVQSIGERSSSPITPDWLARHEADRLLRQFQASPAVNPAIYHARPDSAEGRNQELRRQQATAQAVQLVKRARDAENEGRLDDAHKIYAEAVRLDPDNAQAQAGYDDVLARRGKAPRSSNIINEQSGMISTRRSEIDYRFNTSITEATTAINNDQWDVAEAALERAQLAAGADRNIYSADALWRFDQAIDETRRTLDRARQRELDSAESSRNTTSSERIHKEQEQARHDRERTLRDLKITVRDLYAQARYSEALNVVDQIRVIDPNDEYAIGVRPVMEDKYEFQMQRMLTGGGGPLIPYDDILRYPTDWPDLTALRDQTVRPERGESTEDRAVQARLDRQLPEVQFDGVGLGDAVDFLRDVSGANLFVNWKVLAAAGIERNTPVSARLRNVKFGKALATVLDAVPGRGRVTYAIQGNVIVISTAADLSRGSLVTRVYALRAAPEAGVTRQDLVERITAAIRQNVAPDSWRDAGGTLGTIRELQGQLIVTQTPENQRAVMGVLERLRLTGVVSQFDRLPVMVSGVGDWETLAYRPLEFSNDPRVFSDLLQYAPGMNTTPADVRAVLEAEGPADLRAPIGKIDPAARKLIDLARATGWRRVTVPGPDGNVTIRFDGAGRYTWDRTVGENLHEQVVCDGATLWHLYPEIGVGAKRSVSRFHRAALAQTVPWALPPAEDLAHGMDVVALDARTVALVPHEVASAPAATTRPAAYRRMELAFAGDGRLAERRAVLMPEGKILFRETYDGAGGIRRSSADGKALADRRLTVEECAAPDLVPHSHGLVVLPMPWRSADHVAASHKIAADDILALRQLKEEDALALLAGDVAAGAGRDAANVVAGRFFASGDRRVGFYTLLLAAGHSWDKTAGWRIGGDTFGMDVAADHPKSPLAAYLALQLAIIRGEAGEHWANPDVAADSFIHRLAEFRTFARACLNHPTGTHNSTELANALKLARGCKDPAIGWGILCLVESHFTPDADSNRAAADAAVALADVPGLEYPCRYERSRLLHLAGRGADSRQAFIDLYHQTLSAGTLPPINAQFRECLVGDAGAADSWPTLMRETFDTLVARDGRPAAIAVAWQCHEAGDPALADELLGRALADATAEDKVMTTLSAVDYLCRTGQPGRADELLRPVLDDAEEATFPELWRLASALAAQHGALARSAACLEKALDLEYRRLPESVDLRTFRVDYAGLLSRYAQLADAAKMLEQPAPPGMAAAVLRTADRWRALDPDPAAACQMAARVLEKLGLHDLAWEYLTSPLADHPADAGPWQQLAATLAGRGETDLADRAYAAASELDPTDPQFLWDRAQLLQQHGRRAEAMRLIRQVANGDWSPRFNSLKAQAQGYGR
ncbi:MAG TPA: VIT domain-containing protein [Tepidisphaeraceae bacterium]|jgi:ferric-dicitrate binding protein FerR (iron transport regulator)|nr:VIT domain-containing protein [Tepidisphaeraceae bacterium]